MNRNRKKLSIFFSALIFVVLTYLLAWSPIFTVKGFEIIGSPTNSVSAEISKSSGVEIGQQLARVDPRSISRRLHELPWINSVGVSRNWFSGKVTLKISARVPVAIFNGRAIDKSGQLFDYQGSIDKGLPIVSGASATSGLGAISLFKSLPQDFRNQIQSLSATTETTYLMHLLFNSRDLKIIWGGNEGSRDIALKIKVINALLALPENQHISRIDVSAPHAPIVK